MPKSNLQTAAVITLRSGADIISELEARHRAAERDLAGAETAVRDAGTRYEAALGEGREAALAARRVQDDAEVDRDIARRAVDVLSRQVADAREALRVTEIEHRRAEAERLRSVFEETARQQLAAMAVGARAIIRAWAEAELAIEAARQVQRADGPPIPSIEAFRSVPRQPRREVRRHRITKWLRPGTNDAFPDEFDQQIVRKGSTGWLRHAGMSGGGREIAERGEFDRITYAKEVPPIYVPPLVESLSIPALVGGEVPGWVPVEGLTPHGALARLADLERAPPRREPQHETVDVYICRVNGGKEGADAAS
ncbi:hypothetical protein M446_7057 (plasmid) [Methylobacterium sp. 4-46]|uniref:hypothetical protein n=1 Tax=Methylobacterium sp. (strain 4-46) TaxID=426117 RepID=UPI000165CC7C|nr:hypothetical protein [Methylobacterium sp. 4-46]ACA21275.1 hypothetical protein M446_7057 [Methylobacterium sp. 4-46]